MNDYELAVASATQCTRKTASQPTTGLALIKKTLNASWANTLDEQLDLERDSQRAAGRTDDYREGVAAFMAKRKPEFTGN